MYIGTHRKSVLCRLLKKRDYESFTLHLNDIESNTTQIDIFTTTWMNDTLPKMIQLARQAEIMSKIISCLYQSAVYEQVEGQLKSL